MTIIARFSSLRARALSAVERVGPMPALAMRAALGVTFIVSGWGKLHDLANVTTFFESLGIPAAAVQAPVIASLELVGGALVLAGLATRLAALLLAGVMAVAIYTAVWPATTGVVALLGTVEIIYLASFFHLAVHGAGAVSLDRLIHHRLSSSRSTTVTTGQGALA